MMFRRFLSGANFMEKKEDEEEASIQEPEQETDQDEEEGMDENENEAVEALLIPSDHEKKAILASFDAMRKDSLFCDVSFISHGNIFRCHRVVVSSWSRWMRTFLIDSPSDEVLSLDIFAPDALQAVLDYMYGHPLQVTEEVSKSQS
jgi:hypothetical protein